ncbi:MAG: 50S ribosomal protein L21 [Alphaproteobacteria bacterium]|nr:MAG: 50S ribosomal protein L21 [Alphaproteobacteria bacterium]TAF14620.1 MAG: 50S ribosomal protein L21 [Alphaproteobacteria bacterium]TAF41707.1 MAG: 50S ribosomal protein L21 [Alphaproteobacteria bacterium]TAF75648.1 MAG: 50S ribosomal protein L21 [Alphaproteobacteria bacterium]
MFAIIETGGKQYSVTSGNKLAVAKIEGDIGDVIEFTRVLMAGSKIGTPVVEGATVTATIINQTRTAKIWVFKKKRRQNYRRMNGHRQHQTIVRIDAIAA